MLKIDLCLVKNVSRNAQRLCATCWWNDFSEIPHFKTLMGPQWKIPPASGHVSKLSTKGLNLLTAQTNRPEKKVRLFKWVKVVWTHSKISDDILTAKVGNVFWKHLCYIWWSPVPVAVKSLFSCFSWLDGRLACLSMYLPTHEDLDLV